MLSSRSKIRLAFLGVALISLGTSLLSLSYLNRITARIEQMVKVDAKVAELGESISIKMLEARREEKNYIIYLDTVHIVNNRFILEDIERDVLSAKEISPAYTTKLDSISMLIESYGQNIRQLAFAIQDDPRTIYRLQQQIINYEQELRSLARRRKLSVEDLPSWTSDVNIALLSASTKLSTEKAQLFSDLRDIGNRIMALSQEITVRARESMAKNSAEGISYSVKAERNTATLLLLAALLLVFLIVYLPHRIFLPYSKISKALQAIGRGESEIQLPNIEAGDELGDLSRSFQEAIQKMRTFSDLKTAKISQIQRNLYRILEEVEEAILILSPDLTILYLNDSAQSLLDVDRDVVSRSIRELDMLWGLLNKLHVDLEKRDRYDVKMKKRGLGKRRISIIPSTSNSGKVDNIVIVIG